MKVQFSALPPEIQRAVNAYDQARRHLANSYTITGPGAPAMSDANKATIAPMIEAAVKAYTNPDAWGDLEDDITDAICDSMDMDWTSRDGARAVVAYLKGIGAILP